MTDAPDPSDVEHQLTVRTRKINESLEALEIKVNLSDAKEDGEFRRMLRELRDDEAALLDSARRIAATAGEHGHDMGGRLMRALERLEGAVQTAWADFEAEAADDLDAYRAAAAKQAESWRGQVDRLRLHAKLAEMETRSAVDDMERAFDAARPELDRAKESAGEALEALRQTGREFVAHLRQAANDASRKIG